MKKLIAVLAVALLFPAFLVAYEPPEFRLIEAELQKQTYDVLLQQQYVTIASNAAITAFDTTATNTTSVSYLPSTITYPCKLVVKNNHATNMVVYVPYDDGLPATSGVVIPTATASRLVDNNGDVVVAGKEWSTILYEDPEISFGAISNAPARADSEVIFEVWTRPTIEY